MTQSMRCFVISLEEAHERRKRFFTAAERHNWQVEVFTAVDKADLIVTSKGQLRAEVTHRTDKILSLDVVAGKTGHISMKVGEYACALSHMILWKKLLASGDSHWCIFEDDAVIENPYSRIPLPEDADFVFLSDRVQSVVPSEIQTDAEFDDWVARTPFAPLLPGVGTEAYIVTSKGASAGLGLMNQMYWPIDLQLMSYGHGTINCGHYLAEDRLDLRTVCRLYSSNQTYTHYEDLGISYIND